MKMSWYAILLEDKICLIQTIILLHLRHRDLLQHIQLQSY